MIIRKKCWPEFFEKVLSGEKSFEVRLADFKCKEGEDILRLEEWDPKTKHYTGRKLDRAITYALNTKDLEFWSKEDIEMYGFLIMSLKETM